MISSIITAHAFDISIWEYISMEAEGFDLAMQGRQNWGRGGGAMASPLFCQAKLYVVLDFEDFNWSIKFWDNTLDSIY